MLCLLLGACTTLSQSSPLIGGSLSGKVSLGWENTTEYVYLPDTAKPLTYTFPASFNLADSQVIALNPTLRMIKPQAMFTDGGSIPRILWSADGFSPFDYLPAYVVHDWLYFQNRCHGKAASYFKNFKEFPYSKDLADRILADTLESIDRKLAEKGKNRPANAAQVRALIFKAVKDFGNTAWSRPDDCIPPPDPTLTITQTRTVPDQTIKMGERTFRSFRTETRKVETSRYRLLVTVDLDD